VRVPPVIVPVAGRDRALPVVADPVATGVR
jgi:hypothetical protein